MWICLPQAGLPSIRDEIEAAWLEGRGELTEEQVLWILFWILFRMTFWILFRILVGTLVGILFRILVGHIRFPKFLIRGVSWQMSRFSEKSLILVILFFFFFYTFFLMNWLQSRELTEEQVFRKAFDTDYFFKLFFIHILILKFICGHIWFQSFCSDLSWVDFDLASSQKVAAIVGKWLSILTSKTIEPIHSGEKFLNEKN